MSAAHAWKSVGLHARFTNVSEIVPAVMCHAITYLLLMLLWCGELSWFRGGTICCLVVTKPSFTSSKGVI